MGKGMRLKEERKATALQPMIVNTISINMLSNGGVNVSGPITDPILVLSVFSKAFNALAVHYAQERDKQNKIVVPTSGLILPH